MVASTKLSQAINALSKFYGLYTMRDLAARIALNQLQGIQGQTSADLPEPPPGISELIRVIIDTSEGTMLSPDLVNYLNNTSQDVQVRERLHRLLKIYYSNPDLNFLSTSEQTPNDIASMLANNSSINSNPTSPDKQHPALSVIFINNVRVAPIHKNVNATTIFFNGIPTIELNRMVPYLDIQFMFGRPPLSTNHRIQTPSLFKFLVGAEEVSSGGAARLMLDASIISGSQASDHPTSDQYTSAGMELFCAPQTLVNADETANTALRATAVLDKFQPLMSLKSFDVEVQSSGFGIIAFKTAKLAFVLHDRSRMTEIADFIRPDLYGTTELLIEYGWSHPDKPEQNNQFANLINAMRVKEKYGIVNSSFTFDDSGQVNISLELAMRGGIEFFSELISSDEASVSRFIREMDQLTQDIGELRRRIFGTNNDTTAGMRAVTGAQFLDVAQDARTNLSLTGEQRREFASLRQALRSNQASNYNTRRLVEALDKLYGDAQNENDGLVGQARTTVTNAIKNKMQALMRAGDPFIVQSSENTDIQRRDGRRITTTTPSSASATEDGLVFSGSPSVSLAKLLMLFVGKPLATTGKFDDVQFIFYPFNSYAAFAHKLNIGQFAVDTRFFYQQYKRLRLESIARTGDMSLRDFISFITSTIIDDPAAYSYGLQDRTGAFYRTIRNQNNQQQNQTAGQPTGVEAVSNPPVLQTRMEHLLRGITPDGSFKMPQVDFYIECLPSMNPTQERAPTQVEQMKSVLRIHVFDKQQTSYDTQAALLASAREEELRSIGHVPDDSGNSTDISTSQAESANAILGAANNLDLIERIQGTNMYRIKGGQKQLKEFLMKTMPYIIYGCAGTTVKQANLTSMQDPSLSTINMSRSFRAGPLDPTGERPGGIPLRIIPCEAQMDCLGNPLVEFAQQYFIDFQTGTTADNIYGITGISHKIEPGLFTSNIKMVPIDDAYGKYESTLENIQRAVAVLEQATRNR